LRTGQWQLPDWVRGCLRDHAVITAGVPQIAADLLHRASRQGRATTTAVRSGCGAGRAEPRLPLKPADEHHTPRPRAGATFQSHHQFVLEMKDNVKSKSYLRPGSAGQPAAPHGSSFNCRGRRLWVMSAVFAMSGTSPVYLRLRKEWGTAAKRR
jgi:hypothetical protein